jgi:uracil-DNA glycosylase
MSSTVIDLENIKLQLIQKLKPSGWADRLKGFIHSSDFDEVIQKLIDAKESGKRFTPPMKHVFKAFEECPYNNIRVCIIGQDPYPQLGVADGLAFSCSITGSPQPSLRYIFDAIEETVHQGFPTQQSSDLTRWANQGVLLLNSALTTEINKPATQYDIWQPFLAYVLDILNTTQGSMIFVLMGKKAQEFAELLDEDRHTIFKVSHPASAAYSKSVWDCQNVFNNVNQVIKQMNGSEYCINW